MNEKPSTNNRNGTTLIVVMGMTLLGTLAAASVMFCVGWRTQLASRLVDLEQAFYLAAAGAERSATYVINGHTESATLTGTLGNGRYVSTIACTAMAGGGSEIDVTSVGTADGVSRTVILHGLRHVSWARYALWYSSESAKLWMAPGEKFSGRVYSGPQFHFSDQDLATKGQVHFYDRAWSAATTVEKASTAVSPIFDDGLILGVTAESMSSISFSDLLSQSTTGGLVLPGATTIVLNGTTMTINNALNGWTNRVVAIPNNGIVYVQTTTVTSTSYQNVWVSTGWRSGYWSSQPVTTSATYPGDITVSAPSGLNGRLTLVAENNINIIDHVRYAANPATDATSDDALGLIAQQDVVVKTSAPNNLSIYAHITCINGGFGVENYNTGSLRGTLTVYGGIVNSIRKAVGTIGSTGYSKNYIFDTRFEKNPPPCYPKLPDELEWTEWDG